MSDFGVKLSLPGNDIETADDTQLLFNSEWPNIKIFKNIHVQGTFSTTPQNIIIYNHGLGFVPAVIPYNLGLTGQRTDVAEIIATNINTDNQNIYFAFQGSGSTLTLDIRLSILYLDIEQAFTAPVVQTGPSAAAKPDPNFGFKISKNNKDIGSTDMRDFILHSSARSPMVHAVVPGVIPGQPPGSGNFSYTHDLPYNPMFFAYVNQPAIGLGTGAYFLQNGFFDVQTTGSTITLVNNLNGAPVSIVILKDPFQITDNVINVSL